MELSNIAVLSHGAVRLLFSLMEQSDIADHDFLLFSLMEQSDIADHNFLLFSLVEQSDIAVLSHVAVRHCCSLSWSSQTLLIS